jgi:NAD(P)-dependent dehydrogenase (short-subunit alcohol dehydrogenase family)
MTVLITGCSSGIGHAAAIRLHEAGLRVHATASQLGLPKRGQLSQANPSLSESRSYSS